MLAASKAFLRSRTASLVGSNRISRRRRTAIGIMILLYSSFSNACTGTSLAMFQIKENRWLYCAVFIRYKNNHFLRKSTPALSALCVRQSVGLWWCGPKCWLPPARACIVRASCLYRACLVCVRQLAGGVVSAVSGRSVSSFPSHLCCCRLRSCGLGAKMCLAYATRPFSVRRVWDRRHRTAFDSSLKPDPCASPPPTRRVTSADPCASLPPPAVRVTRPARHHAPVIRRLFEIIA